MKTAVVYYSMSSNCEYVADKIIAQLDADIIRIEPEKSYPSKGARKFIWGGKAAVMGDKPTLKPYKFNADDYDTVIIGSPVWASNFAPPIRTFLDENKGIADKKLAAFFCFSGGGADKAVEKLRAFIGKEELSAKLILIDPKDKPEASNDAEIKSFCDALK